MIDDVPPGDLAATRLQLHWSLQPLASVAFALAEPASDDGHTTVQWRGRAFHGRTLPGGHHLGVDPNRWTIGFFDASDAPIEALSLPGRTLESVQSWITTRLKVRGHVLETGLTTPPYDPPQELAPQDVLFEPLAHGEALADWFELALGVLSDVTASLDEASAVRLWPHHFDMASLLTLENETSINLGFSPGDGSIDQPYFYVTPWPRPEDPELPELSHGATWHADEDFFAAILTAEALGDADDRAQAAHQMLQSALVAATAML